MMMWWPIGIVFVIVCMVMMGRMMGHGMFSSPGHGSEGQGPDVPERILANRLASGEIDVEDYERLRDELQRTRESSPNVGRHDVE
jgi:uncharacterized membrane protein